MSRFESKHIKRDVEIPKHREIIKKAIELDLLDDLDVIAVFYGGSIGNQDSDNYSDIDLRIVVTDRAFKDFRKNKKERANRWGNILFFEDVPYANYSVAHYDRFVKVDMYYYRLKDILPAIWFRNIEVVYDASEMLEDIVKRSEKLTFTPSAEDVEYWRTKFFAYLHETYRRVMRGELYYALNCLDNLRFSIVTAWYMEAGIQPNALGDWAKIEGARSQLQVWQLSKLAEWDCNRDPSEIMKVIENIIPEFKRTHKSLCEEVTMDENVEWVEQILNAVL